MEGIGEQRALSKQQKLPLALKGYSFAVNIYFRRKGRTEADWILTETVCVLVGATPAEAPEGLGASDPLLADVTKGSAWEPMLSGLMRKLSAPGHELMSRCVQPEQRGWSLLPESTCTMSSLAGHPEGFR